MTKVQDKKQKMDINQLSDGWVEVSLGDVGKVITGKTPSRNNPEDWGENIDFITPSDLKTDSKYITSTARSISEKGKERFKTMIIPKDTVIVTCIGSDMGKVVLNKRESLTNQQINSLVIDDKNDYNFCYYLLKNAYKVLRQSAEGSGSTMPILNKTNFENLIFKIPQKPEIQKSIAKVLSSFDDKIELLREQNETLEKIGQEIFKEWFGKHKVGDKLPDGWRVGKIEDFGKIICGKTPSKNNKENFDGKIPFIKIPDMHDQMFILNTADSLSEAGANSQKNKFISKNSICVSCIATVGLVSITMKDSQTNQQINSIILDEDIHLEYLYFSLKQMKKYLLDIGKGGAVTLNINTGTFSNIELVIPANQTLEKFSKITKSLFEKIKNNSEQIQTLSKTRDIFLPKLMKGDFDVN